MYCIAILSAHIEWCPVNIWAWSLSSKPASLHRRDLISSLPDGGSWFAFLSGNMGRVIGA